MTGAAVLDIAREGIWVLILVSAPMMLVGLVVGVVIALFQALTQIQEMTLTFVPKIVVMFGALVLLAPFMLGQLTSFTEGIMDKIVAIETGGK